MDSRCLEIIEFTNSRLLNLHLFEPDEYPDWEFYMNSDNSNVFQFREDFGLLNFVYTTSWETLETEYEIKDSDFRCFIHAVVKDLYGLDAFSEIRKLQLSVEWVKEMYVKTLD